MSNNLPTMSNPAQKMADMLGFDNDSAHLQSLNHGSAEIAARISGAKSATSDNSQAKYFTDAEGHPWPDPAHSKNVGGLPLVSDTFLLQKQQTFNRSKALERMVSWITSCCRIDR